MKKTSYWNLIIQRTRSGCKVWNTLEDGASWRRLLNGEVAIVGTVAILADEDCILVEKAGEEKLLNI